MKKSAGWSLAAIACISVVCTAHAQSSGLNPRGGDAPKANARGVDAQTFNYAALAESLAAQKLTTLRSLAAKLKQKDVCGNQATAADQLCAIALYLGHDEKGKPRASVAPVLSLIINEMPTDAPALLHQNKFAAARYVYTLDPGAGRIGKYPFSFLLDPRYRSAGDGTAALKYEFVTVIGREENRARHYGIPPDAFELRTYTSF